MAPVVCGLKCTNTWDPLASPGLKLLDQLEYSSCVIGSTYTHDVEVNGAHPALLHKGLNCWY